MYAKDAKLTQVEDALCSQTDPEAFFPEKGGTSRIAKKVCAKCSLTLQCLLTALENREEFGVWGGAGVRERERIRTKTQAVEFVHKLKLNTPQ